MTERKENIVVMPAVLTHDINNDVINNMVRCQSCYGHVCETTVYNNINCDHAFCIDCFIRLQGNFCIMCWNGVKQGNTIKIDSKGNPMIEKQKFKSTLVPIMVNDDILLTIKYELDTSPSKPSNVVKSFDFGIGSKRIKK
jgi:hypothetical protein